MRIYAARQLCSFYARKQHLRLFSTQTAAQIAEEPWMASGSKFGTEEEGRWTIIPQDDAQALKFYNILPKYLRRQGKTIGEYALMLRRPFLDIKTCLAQLHPRAPTPRFVLFGNFGTGKDTTLVQTAHYGWKEGWVLIHLPTPFLFTRVFKEVSTSTWKPGRVDLPLRGTELLENFRSLNASNPFPQNPEVITTKEYKWAPRDITKEGSSLMDIVEMGIAKPKLSSDCVGGLFRELKLHATAGRIRLLVVIGDSTPFFYDSKIRREDRSFVAAGDISLVHHFKGLLQPDWCGGCVVTSVTGRQFSGEKVKVPVLPHALLQREGFEHMDPFIPIETENFTEKEANFFLDYLEAKNWIQHKHAKTPEGRKQLMHLADFNPYALERLCSPL